MSNIVKTVSEIGFKNGSKLIMASNNPDALRKVLSEGMYQALSLYSDVKVEAVQIMMKSIMEDYKYEPVEVIEQSIKDLAGGKKKIFGRVTPNDIREVIQENLEKVAQQREANHEAKKKESYIQRGKQTSLRDYIKGQKRK